ncbi:uncharacterized protein C6orf47 homolog isoform X2 [Stigmatopora argus]
MFAFVLMVHLVLPNYVFKTKLYSYNRQQGHTFVSYRRDLLSGADQLQSDATQRCFGTNWVLQLVTRTGMLQNLSAVFELPNMTKDYSI